MCGYRNLLTSGYWTERIKMLMACVHNVSLSVTLAKLRVEELIIIVQVRDSRQPAG